MTTKCNYRHALTRIGAGFRELMGCLLLTLINSIRDVARGAIHHPVVSLILMALIASMFCSLLKARSERDEAYKNEYTLQQQNDSLRIAIEPFIKEDKNEYKR